MTVADPTLFGPAYSTYARTARLALEEKGVPYTLKEVDIMSGPVPAEHKARHPWGKVPAFEHDGFAVYETSAITRYVDETFKGPKLQPDDPKKRARMNQIMSILDSYAYPSMVSDVVVQRLVVPLLKGTPDEAKIAQALPKCETCLDALENLAGAGEFLAGEQISLADLLAVPIFDYFAMTPEGKQALAKKPKLSRWWNKIKDRASVAKTRPSLG